MRGGGSDGPREDDWLAEEDWVDAPTEETRRSPSRRRLPQRPPGAPSRGLIILAAAVSIVLLAVLVAVLQGDDDAAGDPAPTVTPTETTAAPGSEAEPSLRLQESGTLSEGDSGPRVRRLQRALARLGLDVSSDGVYGPGTTEAVRRFQADAGLDADGVVGPQTASAINDALAAGE
jgi:murein L,D-transpeptidase YcbB/YkuD